MKAKDLIKILEKFPNKEVKFYNGYVNDWMDISVVESELFKLKEDVHLELINNQNKNKDKELTKEEYKKQNINKNLKYEFKNRFMEDDVINDSFTKKKVLLIQGKLRGLSSFDRAGTLKY